MLARLLLAVGGWVVNAFRRKAGHDIQQLLGGSKIYRMKLLVALAAAAAFESIAVVAAVAGGVATVGTKVAIAKSRLGSILVDSK